MTAHPIDTEALAKRAGHILFTEGPEQPAATARETCVLLDLLAAAEHRATRAEAQSAIRGRAVQIYQQRARTAEAERDQERKWRLELDAAHDEEIENAEKAEARIKAVEDLCDRASRDAGTLERNLLGGHRLYPKEIRRALDGSDRPPRA